MAPMRDSAIWENKNGEWIATDSVTCKSLVERDEPDRVKPSSDRTFAASNRGLYFNPETPPDLSGEAALDQKSVKFSVL